MVSVLTTPQGCARKPRVRNRRSLAKLTEAHSINKIWCPWAVPSMFQAWCLSWSQTEESVAAEKRITTDGETCWERLEKNRVWTSSRGTVVLSRQGRKTGSIQGAWRISMFRNGTSSIGEDCSGECNPNHEGTQGPSKKAWYRNDGNLEAQGYKGSGAQTFQYTADLFLTPKQRLALDVLSRRAWLFSKVPQFVLWKQLMNRLQYMGLRV